MVQAQAHQQTPSVEIEQIATPSQPGAGGNMSQVFNQKKVALSVMSSNSNKHNLHNKKAS